jgi:hypothetical protein
MQDNKGETFEVSLTYEQGVTVVNVLGEELGRDGNGTGYATDLVHVIEKISKPMEALRLTKKKRELEAEMRKLEERA